MDLTRICSDLQVHRVSSVVSRTEETLNYLHCTHCFVFVYWLNRSLRDSNLPDGPTVLPVKCAFDALVEAL